MVEYIAVKGISISVIVSFVKFRVAFNDHELAAPFVTVSRDVDRVQRYFQRYLRTPSRIKKSAVP